MSRSRPSARARGRCRSTLETESGGFRFGVRSQRRCNSGRPLAEARWIQSRREASALACGASAGATPASRLPKHVGDRVGRLPLWRAEPAQVQLRPAACRSTLATTMPLALEDCRQSSSGCGFGECAPPMPPEEAGGVWVCRCDAGWTRFPARGAAEKCTVNASLTLALCAVSAVCAISLLAGIAISRRVSHRSSTVPLICACVLCLIADIMQVLEPASIVWVDPWVTVLKAGSGLLLNDVFMRFTFLRYRTVLLAKMRQTTEASAPVESGDVQGALLRRTYFEIAMTVCVWAPTLCLGLSSLSTRITSSFVFAYCAWGPAVVAKFIAQTTRSILESLKFISASLGETGGDMGTRVNVARSKALAVRNTSFMSYAFIFVWSLCALALSEYTAQYVHLQYEGVYVAALGGCAVNQCAQIRIRARSGARSRAKKAVVSVVPSPKPGGVVQPGHSRVTK
jgi:hypothetical protein